MPPIAKNQNPEQIARDQIDAKLAEAGWHVQDRDKLDFPHIIWLKDKGLTDLDNLPEPDTLAEEIIENLESGLARFRAVLAGLSKAG